MKKNIGVFLFPWFLVASMASAAVDCTNVKLTINAENTAYYQGLVQQALTEKVSVKQIDISDVLASKEWLAVFASTNIAEPGVFFFRNKTFVDVWGGVVEQDEKPTVVKWAQGIHAPDELVECFFEEIVIQ